VVARLLVVDDEPVVRQVLHHHLVAAGYQIDKAPDGEEGLRLFKEGPYDLVILDVMMPRLSGFEVCRRIRRTHSARELPVLFLSAKGQPQDRVAGLEAGANDYLTKPVDRSELIARVGLHLELLRMHQRQEELLAERTSRLKILSGLLPICSSCRKIRDDEGYWDEIESYIALHSEAEFSHGLCPECASDLYPRLKDRSPPDTE
jgi:DNA-binding response OmpR family regulator